MLFKEDNHSTVQYYKITTEKVFVKKKLNQQFVYKLIFKKKMK